MSLLVHGVLIETVFGVGVMLGRMKVVRCVWPSWSAL